MVRVNLRMANLLKIDENEKLKEENSKLKEENEELKIENKILKEEKDNSAYNPVKILRNTNKKSNYYNAYEKWNEEEEFRLLHEYNSEIKIKEISEMHGRTVGAIKSRLRILGIKI